MITNRFKKWYFSEYPLFTKFFFMKTAITSNDEGFRNPLTLALQQFRHPNFTQQSLARVQNRADLLRWLYRYVTFNGIFAGGVANLAGEVHIQTALFRDPHDEWPLFADRSANIAARIFFAAEDEYANHRQLNGAVIHHHRYLAQLFLRSVADFWQISPALFQQHYGYDYAPLQQTLQAVLRGYCVNQTNTEETLFRGIGFHLGSEHLADGEFCTLDAYLRETQPDLVRHLRKLGKPNAYTWVAVHTTVEAEHAEHAVAAAEEAVLYYNGAYDRQQARQWILEGIAQFAQVQEQFFAQILG